MDCLESRRRDVLSNRTRRQQQRRLRSSRLERKAALQLRRIPIPELSAESAAPDRMAAGQRQECQPIKLPRLSPRISYRFSFVSDCSSLTLLAGSVELGSVRPYLWYPCRLRCAIQSACRSSPTGRDLSKFRQDYQSSRPYRASRTQADTARGT